MNAAKLGREKGEEELCCQEEYNIFYIYIRIYIERSKNQESV